MLESRPKDGPPPPPPPQPKSGLPDFGHLKCRTRASPSSDGEGSRPSMPLLITHYKRSRFIVISNRITPVALLPQRPASLLQGSPGDAAVAQRQSNRFVSDRLTVRIRPAAPAHCSSCPALRCSRFQAAHHHSLALRIIIDWRGRTNRLVMAGLSASKTRVNALMSRPSTSLLDQAREDVDARQRRQVYAVCASLTACRA